MARAYDDSRKSLGMPVKWTCDLCGKEIRAHTTTVALASLQHRRMHEKNGEKCRGDYRKLTMLDYKI